MIKLRSSEDQIFFLFISSISMLIHKFDVIYQLKSNKKVMIIQKSKSSSTIEKVLYYPFLPRVNLRPIDASITSLAVVRC